MRGPFPCCDVSLGPVSGTDTHDTDDLQRENVLSNFHQSEGTGLLLTQRIVERIAPNNASHRLKLTLSL